MTTPKGKAWGRPRRDGTFALCHRCKKKDVRVEHLCVPFESRTLGREKPPEPVKGDTVMARLRWLDARAQAGEMTQDEMYEFEATIDAVMERQREDVTA